MVKELGAIKFEHAVKKLTADAADQVGLDNRGRLKEGAHADVIVFDRARFGERGTLAEPNVLAEGMAHVVIDGGVTMEDGKFSDTRMGRVLRRN